MSKKSSDTITVDQEKRSFFGGAAVGGLVLTGAVGALSMLKSSPAEAALGGLSGAFSDWYDVKKDFLAVGDGYENDTVALQNAIDAGSANQRPIFIPNGAYKITEPLLVKSNTMIAGSNEGLNFGTVIKPVSCAAFDIVGVTDWVFHGSIRNLMIWPTGTAPSHFISVDKAYSFVLSDIRIHTAEGDQWSPKTAAIVLKGAIASGGTGLSHSNNIVWENIVVRSDSGQPNKCILAEPGCGTHRFIALDVENYGTLFHWRGGQIDLVLPYTERAGALAVDVDSVSEDAYLNTFGGIIACADSGWACGIRPYTRNFNSYGTQWINRSTTQNGAAYVYGLPAKPAVFHGIIPNLSGTGSSRFRGAPTNWQNGFSFPDAQLKALQPITQTSIPANSQITIAVSLLGVAAGIHWARANVNTNLSRVLVSAAVSAPNVVTVVLQNLKSTSVTIPANSKLFVDAGVF